MYKSLIHIQYLLHLFQIKKLDLLRKKNSTLQSKDEDKDSNDTATKNPMTQALGIDVSTVQNVISQQKEKKVESADKPSKKEVAKFEIEDSRESESNQVTQSKPYVRKLDASKEVSDR